MLSCQQPHTSHEVSYCILIVLFSLVFNLTSCSLFIMVLGVIGYAIDVYLYTYTSYSPGV